MEEPEAKGTGPALVNRKGMNWRSPKQSEPQMRPKTTTFTAPRTQMESVLVPALLGVVMGLGLTAAVFGFGEQSLRYHLARAASPAKGMVMFVQLGQKSRGAAGIFKRQAKVKVTLSSPGNQISATTDSFGMLALPELSAADYALQLSCDGYETVIGTVKVRPGGPTIVGWPEPLTLSPLKDS